MTEKSDRPIFELQRLSEYTEKAILAELRRIAQLVPNEALTASIIRKYGRVDLNTIRRRFGTLSDALKRADLHHRSSGQVGVRGAHPSRSMTNDDVLAALRDLAEKLRKSELTVADVKSNLPFSSETLRRRWGTSRAAFEAAGLAATNLGRRYSDEECFANLLTVWTHYGRPPMYREMTEPPSRVGGKAYVKRFGRWNKALAAFVERVNQDRDLETQVTTEMPEASSRRTVRRSEESRDIPLGLRFRVLQRDHFKCVLCGDHPARNPECVLHVDHVNPWSKGGKTREDNLRSLCATCNVGRGNRFAE